MTDSQTYWIIFKNAGENPPFWVHFLKSGFEHCLILTQDKFNWYVVDPTRRTLRVQILYYDPIYNFPHHLRTKTKTTIIKIIMSPPKKNYIKCKLNLLNCVTIVKYMLGLHVKALTPWQLYKCLRRLRNDNDAKAKLGIDTISFLF